MIKEFVPYEQALALKELGFDESCFGLYAPPSKTVFLHHYGLLSAKEQILAPTFSQAFRWFRDKYDLHVHIRKENYFQQSAYEYFYFDISRGREKDITKQEDLLCDIFDECSQDIPGNYLNDEKYSKLIFKRKFAFKTYEEIELACLLKLIEIVKNK